MDIERLKQARKSLKITYKELSKKSNIPEQTIYDVFRGVTQNPRIDTVQAIERALGLENGENANKGVFLTDEETRLLTAFRGLIPEMQEYIIKIVENLTGEKKETEII